MASGHFKLVFFSPRNTTQKILTHLYEKFPQGVGNIGQKYDQCAFVTPGTGQFRPIAGAKPAIGSVGKLEFVSEDRVELIIVNDTQLVKDAVVELKNVHPYEEVAYEVYKLESF